MNTIEITPPAEKQGDPLLDHLDASHIRLPEFGCFAALSPDRETIYWCPMYADESPQREDGRMDWGEVTAPEPEFVERINELYGTAFRYERFAGR